jgi:hypothetical protein
MDENVQQKITLACIALLQKNAADSQQARQCTGRRSPTTKKEAIALLLSAASEPDITLANVTDALWIIFKRSKPASQTRQWVTQLLLDLGQQEDITASDAVEVATALYLLSPQGSPEQQEGIQRLLALAKRRDIPFGDTVEAAHSLYVQSPHGSQERQQAIEMLLAQARWPDTTVAQAQEAALALCNASAYRPKERNQAIQALIELTRRPGLSFEDALLLDWERAIIGSTRALHQQQWEAKKQMWETIAQCTDLTSEQREQVLTALEVYRWLLKDLKG